MNQFIFPTFSTTIAFQAYCLCATWVLVCVEYLRGAVMRFCTHAIITFVQNVQCGFAGAALFVCPSRVTLDSMSTLAPIVSQQLPVIDDALLRYLQEIKKFPMLSPEEEQNLANDWVQNGNLNAAHKLITSHLRLVAKIALSYKGYGLPMQDVIAEGNIGLMQAVRGYDPSKGFRLATYAMWWIRAAIQDYILRSWSLVKIGTTATQKKLFFNLRQARQRLAQTTPDALAQNTTLAEHLEVTEQDIIDMAQRLQHRDASLNAPLSADDHTTEAIDVLPDTRPTPDMVVATNDEQEHRRQVLLNALQSLGEREKIIIAERWLRDPPTTFDDLAQRFGISRERVRQIEHRALEKMREVAHLFGAC